MREKRWTKAGRKLREEKPNLFTGGSGKEAHKKGGPHRRDIDYNRSEKRREERQINFEDYED